MEFVYAAACLRGQCYELDPPTGGLHEARRVAGRIIPAIATTTSVVAGLACLELYKVVGRFYDREEREGDDLATYKDAFINLALPLFTFSEPAPAKVMPLADRSFTKWDVLKTFDSTATTEEIIASLEAEFDIEVFLLSVGTFLTYAGFMAEKKRKERLAMTPLEVVRSVTEKSGKDPSDVLCLKDHVKSVTMEVAADDKEGNDVELPPVRVIVK